MTPKEALRIETTLAAIPADCGAVLDVGAGDGRMCHAVAERLGLPTVAIDLSLAGLARIRLPRCCGSATRLPFADRSFDLVMTTEMLEHIPGPWYAAVLRELARTAGRYLLISVPNRENLREHTMCCQACGARFHAWGHQRSYSPAGLRHLFPGFTVRQLASVGEAEANYNRLLVWLRQEAAGGWHWEPQAQCGRCQAAMDGRPRRPRLARLLDGVNARLWAPVSRRPNWLLALYERDGAAAAGLAQGR
ncbi:MAG TPA: class I SAM-dependent methyltransferase [Terriglobales bacterium]|nr:class I SAM-dependent methyltransferase [Terriglobales bacterium]